MIVVVLLFLLYVLRHIETSSMVTGSANDEMERI